MNAPREEALLALAPEKPAQQRAALLDLMCEGDPSLRARLDALSRRTQGRTAPR